MPSSIALSLSVGVLAGVAAYIALGPLAAILQVWAVFIGWGCFFHSGGNEGLESGIIGNIFGVVSAIITTLLVLNVNLGPLTAAVWVGVLVIIIVYAGATIPLFANIPAAVYG